MKLEKVFLVFGSVIFTNGSALFSMNNSHPPKTINRYSFIMNVLIN